MQIVAKTASESSAPGWHFVTNESLVKKHRAAKTDDLRSSYDPALFKGAVRGKYYERYRAGTNLVLIEPDLFEVFPNGRAVNAALRALIRKPGVRRIRRPAKTGTDRRRSR